MGALLWVEGRKEGLVEKADSAFAVSARLLFGISFIWDEL